MPCSIIPRDDVTQYVTILAVTQVANVRALRVRVWTVRVAVFDSHLISRIPWIRGFDTTWRIGRTYSPIIRHTGRPYSRSSRWCDAPCGPNPSPHRLDYHAAGREHERSSGAFSNRVGNALRRRQPQLLCDAIAEEYKVPVIGRPVIHLDTAAGDMVGNFARRSLDRINHGSLFDVRGEAV